MANPPLPNVWHLRAVAEVASKPCMICFRPSTSVLITPDKKDFFYICKSHLADRGFASALTDPAVEEAKKREQARKEEQERVVAEWKEKQAAKDKKKAKDKEKDKDKDDKKSKDKDKEQDEDKPPDAASPSPAAEETPRVYALHRNFYAMRVERLRKAEVARRSREILKNPNSFPAVPSGPP